jgi:hypothetical protein
MAWHLRVMLRWTLVGVVAVAASGCAHLGDGPTSGHQGVSAVRGAALLDEHGMTGARADVAGAYRGIGFGLGALVDRHHVGDTAPLHTAGQLELWMSASLFGLLSDDHRFERYFDLGAAAGAGGGLAHTNGLTTIAEVWYGPWIEIGLVPGDWEYPALHLEVQQTLYRGAWRDRTTFIVGLSLVGRRFGHGDLDLFGDVGRE